MIVWLVFNRNLREMIGQAKAPTMPEVAERMESSATPVVEICNSVLANRIAVPETVATASERRNQAARNTTTCRSLAAIFIVFHNDTQANVKYAKNERHLLPCFDIADLNGGPGLLRIWKLETRVNENHHNPTTKRTIRRGRVAENDDRGAFTMINMTMLRIWTNTAAAYPIPIPFEDILADSSSSGEADGFKGKPGSSGKFPPCPFIRREFDPGDSGKGLLEFNVRRAIDDEDWGSLSSILSSG